MAKKLDVNTRVRFASPVFSNNKGIYVNEFKKGIITKVLIDEYEVFCEHDKQLYLVPKKGCTKDYYYYTKDDEVCISRA